MSRVDFERKYYDLDEEQRDSLDPVKRQQRFLAMVQIIDEDEAASLAVINQVDDVLKGRNEAGGDEFIDEYVASPEEAEYCLQLRETAKRFR